MKKTKVENHAPVTFTTYWTIMPKDTNYMFPLVFGGAMMSQVDLAAATHARMLLNWSECDKAVTYKADFMFTDRAYAGDTIRFDSRVDEVRDNAIRFVVEAYRCPLPDGENKGITEFEKIGEHILVFVTMLGDKFAPHGLKDAFSLGVL